MNSLPEVTSHCIRSTDDANLDHSTSVNEAPPLREGDEVATTFSLAAGIWLLLRKGGYHSLKTGITRLVRGGGGIDLKLVVLVLVAEYYWSIGNHAEVRRIGHILNKCFRSGHGPFFLAQSEYVNGNLEASFRHLGRLVTAHPKHVEGTCLYARCAFEMGEKELAWTAMEKISLHKSRLKIWIQISQFVHDDADYLRMTKAHDRAVSAGVVLACNRQITQQLAAAACKCGQYSKAKSIWRDFISHSIARKPVSAGRKATGGNYSNSRAEKALLDLRRVLDNAAIEMFLVSGTLLGCVRENRLLGHDKDIDVGIWEDVPMPRLLEALRFSGLFFLIPSRSKEIVRIRHLNGIPLDVFYHYREANNIWHGGVKVRWHNSPFSLAKRTFLGESFLVPENHDLYLHENYGEWRTPKVCFDSAFDTPNGEVRHRDELLVHTFKMLADSWIDQVPSKLNYYLDKLEQLGECEFAMNCRNNIAQNH
jgi:hypothetical protein